MILQSAAGRASNGDATLSPQSSGGRDLGSAGRREMSVSPGYLSSWLNHSWDSLLNSALA